MSRHLPRRLLLPGQGETGSVGAHGSGAPRLSVMSMLAGTWGLGRGSWRAELDGRTLGITSSSCPFHSPENGSQGTVAVGGPSVGADDGYVSQAQNRRPLSLLSMFVEGPDGPAGGNRPTDPGQQKLVRSWSLQPPPASGRRGSMHPAPGFPDSCRGGLPQPGGHPSRPSDRTW